MSVTKSSLNKSERLRMLKNRSWNRVGLPMASLAMLAAAGCHDVVGQSAAPQKQVFPTPEPVFIAAPAGLPVGPAPADSAYKLIHSQTTVTRPDAFRMHDFEEGYDIKARNEKIVQTTGGSWPSFFVPKPEIVQVETVEPQPFRRLAGVLVGDSVMAIIDMGNNTPMQVIRPGMQVPNSPWKVVSIDEEKAILRRTGNKRPKEIIVRLQGPQVRSNPGNVTAPSNPGGGGGGQAPGRRGGNGNGSSGRGGKGGGAGGID